MKKKLGFSILFPQKHKPLLNSIKETIWYLHSEGIGGNNIDFMKKYLNASVKEVLEWAEKQNFSSFQPQNVIHSKIQNQIIKSPKLKNFKTKI
jgi:hypothetical protein